MSDGPLNGPFLPPTKQTSYLSPIQLGKLGHVVVEVVLDRHQLSLWVRFARDPARTFGIGPFYLPTKFFALCAQPIFIAKSKVPVSKDTSIVRARSRHVERRDYQHRILARGYCSLPLNLERSLKPPVLSARKSEQVRQHKTHPVGETLLCENVVISSSSDNLHTDRNSFAKAVAKAASCQSSCSHRTGAHACRRWR
jgi:hypothetical protein